MTDDILADRRRALEESFFRKRNQELLDRLRQEAMLEAKRNEFARVCGIHDSKLIDRLIHMHLESTTAAALSIVPVVQVAWADGSLDDREQEAILAAAVESGMAKESASYHWLKTWLAEKPTPELIDAWVSYVRAFLPTISEDDRQALKEGLLKRVRKVAEATGGILGMGNKISHAEQKVIDDLEAALKW